MLTIYSASIQVGLSSEKFETSV